jgi:hypothetical protein
MASIMGGLGVTIGFPIPFYISRRQDINSTPWIFDAPLLKYVNIVLIYLFSTFVVSQVWKK